MTRASYPNLGFDPAPGTPEAVDGLREKIKSAVDSMNEAHRLMDRLRNSRDAVWQGDAGESFREHFDGALVTELEHAHESLGKAVTTVQGWHTELVHFKDGANRLEQEAAQAHQEQKQAEQSLQQARSNPDLKLANQNFPDDASLQQAQSKLDKAQAVVDEASTKAQNAADKLNDVIRRAKELQQHHEEAARKAAEALRAATVNLAPEQGLFEKIGDMFSDAVDSVGDWVKTHIKDIHAALATTAAVAGLLALCTPPPFDVIAFGVAAVAGVGALVTDAADPQFRKGVKDLVVDHEFSKDAQDALMTGTTDALSAVPGGIAAGKMVGVGGKAAFGAFRGGETAAQGSTAANEIKTIAQGAAHDPGFAPKMLHKLPPVQRAGELGQVNFVDNLLANNPARGSVDQVTSLDRTGFAWKGRAAGSAVYNQTQDSTS